MLVGSLLLSACAAVPASAPASESPLVESAAAEMDLEAAPVEESAAPAAGLAHPTSPAATGAMATGAATDSATRPWQRQQIETVTAGVVDDNADWAAYMDYRARHHNHGAIDIDVSERIIIHVVDTHDQPVHDANVEIYVHEDVVFRGRTDTAGRVIFLPRTLVSSQWRQSNEFRVVTGKGWAARSQTFDRHTGGTWRLVIEDAPRAERTQLDLLFLIDATGSMDDEIDKLKASMAEIADEIARLPEQPDVRYGLVAYRDHGDAFVVRNFDFTPSLPQFQHTLARLEASGGGDEPEALHEALLATVDDVTWRSDETVRMVVLVADAPPHISDFRGAVTDTYSFTVFQAVAQGIKIFPVGASGLNATGEYVFRQLAQISGGKFVFLTYEDGSDPSSGPGTETEHDVDNYSVNTLDRLVVRLVREELANLTQPATTTGQAMQEETPGQLSMLRCDVRFDADDTGNCPHATAFAATDAIQVLETGLLKIRLDPQLDGFHRVRFDIEYSDTPIGYSVNIGDSISNNGDGGDDGDQSNDAEIQIIDDTLAVFASDWHGADIGERMLGAWNSIAHAGRTVSMEISDGTIWVDDLGRISSANLFALNGQQDDEGPINYEIYAAFNRNITGERRGIGVKRVTITLLGTQQ